MARIEVGAQGREVVLLVTILHEGGETGEVVRIPLSLDEARDIVNGMGEAIRFLARS